MLLLNLADPGLYCFSEYLAKYNTLSGPRRDKTRLPDFATNTDADQPAHSRSLISAFVIRFLESIISLLASYEISLL